MIFVFFTPLQRNYDTRYCPPHAAFVMATLISAGTMGEGGGGKRLVLLHQNILFFPFWSKIFAILRNILLHLQYGQWFIEQATSGFCPGFMWNVLTLYWCLAACDVARTEPDLIKSVARSKNHPASLLLMSPPHLAVDDSWLLSVCSFIP